MEFKLENIEQILELLRCPICKGSLTVEDGKLLCRRCNQAYVVREYGIIDMLPDNLVYGSDRRWMEWYDKNADQYYKLFHRIIPMFTLGLEGRARSKWIDLLELRKGDLVLDVATGTGKNIPILRHKVRKDGLVVGVDISLAMLRYAAKLARRFKNVVLIRANASYLPF
jgi:uncharacterized protein YbaR (Trm112 family)